MSQNIPMPDSIVLALIEDMVGKNVEFSWWSVYKIIRQDLGNKIAENLLKLGKWGQKCLFPPWDRFNIMGSSNSRWK